MANLPFFYFVSPLRKMMYHLLLFIQNVPPFLVGQISRLIPHHRRLLEA